MLVQWTGVYLKAKNHENNLGWLRVSKVSAVTAANCSAPKDLRCAWLSFFSPQSPLMVQICVILVSTVVLLSYFHPSQSQRRWCCLSLCSNLSGTVADNWITRSYTLSNLYDCMQTCSAVTAVFLRQWFW